MFRKVIAACGTAAALIAGSASASTYITDVCWELQDSDPTPKTTRFSVFSLKPGIFELVSEDGDFSGTARRVVDGRLIVLLNYMERWEEDGKMYAGNARMDLDGDTLTGTFEWIDVDETGVPGHDEGTATKVPCP